MTKVLGVFVRKSSREQIIENFKLIKRRYLLRKKLIANGNQLKHDAIKAIEKHGDSLRGNDVGTYVAASSLSHSLDGWGYLSQAVNAFMNGNNGVAIHLAYYAELRAVMSILASEGIGVFNNKHIGISKDGNFNFFSKHRRREFVRANNRIQTVDSKLGTHVFAWNAFEKWCKSEVKQSYDLLKIFRVKGHSFSELLPGFHPSATLLVSSAIAKNWLNRWAFDVKRFISDRELRNFVSYRPQTISNFENQINFKSAIRNVYNLFHVLSPSSSNPFDYLDQLLLKALFDELYGKPGISQRGTLEELITESFAHVGSTFDATTQRILLSEKSLQESHLIFSESSKLDLEPLPLISRAALLLRISTGCTSQLLGDAGITKSDLNFVWENYGFNNGFWEIAKPVSGFYELWSEIEGSYSDISSGLDEIEGNSSFIIREQLERDINVLSQFNRAALWGI